MPLEHGSVDQVVINWLYDNIEWDSEEEPDQSAMFGILLRQAKNLLKPTASIIINDVRCNMEMIVTLLEQEGYTVSQPPQILQDTSITQLATFSKVLSEKYPELTPMSVTATVNAPGFRRELF
ncbi:MAG TPA: hypothetical protein VGT05_03830 [Patescibacteria group bacterium]|nr:hypothetical protein [Patescibacteria group bacterium]